MASTPTQDTNFLKALKADPAFLNATKTWVTAVLGTTPTPPPPPPPSPPPTSNAWPSLTSTGPAGINRTTFTPWPYSNQLGAADYSKFPTDSNDYHLIEGFDLTGAGIIYLAANTDHWRFRGCLHLGGGFRMEDPVNDVIFEYCEFGSTHPKTSVVSQTQGVDEPLVLWAGHRVEVSHCQLYHFGTAINNPWDNCNIHDCLIFNPRDPGTGSTADHTDGIILQNGSQGLIVHNCNIDNRLGQTDCIALFGNSVQSNVRITNNLMAGGGYCLYTGTPQNGVYDGNRFSTKYAANAGGFGPYTGDPTVNGSIWTNNKYIDPTGTIDGNNV